MKKETRRYLDVVIGICIYASILEAFILVVFAVLGHTFAVLGHTNHQWDISQVILLIGVLVGMTGMFPVCYVTIRVYCNESRSRYNRYAAMTFLVIYMVCQLVEAYEISTIMLNQILILAFGSFIGVIFISSFYFPIKEYCEEQKAPKK